MKNLALGFILGATAISAASIHLAAPAQDVFLAADFSDRPIPHWVNGYLVAWEVYSPHLKVLNAAGKVIAQTQIQIPGASDVRVTHATKSHSGLLGVGGSAADAAGAGSNFLAWVTADGQTERIVRLNRFAIRQIAFGEGDALWVFGRQLGPIGEKAKVAGDILRHYSRDGILLKSLLPAEGFASKDHPGKRGMLAVANGRVVVYSTTAAEVLEISERSGEVVRRWKGVAASEGNVQGMAVTADAVFVTVKERTAQATALRIYRMPTATGLWEPVDATESFRAYPDDSAMVMGIDGQNLVLGKGPGRLLWVPAP